VAQQLIGNFIAQFSDADGLIVGGSVSFYVAGSSTTKQAIYTDSTKATELANPQTLDALGSLPNEIWLEGSYNIVVKNADGISKWQRDNYDASVSSASTLDWMTSAQAAKAPLGSYTEVNAESIVPVAGDVILGDTDRNSYELRSGGDYTADPESDSYDANTGVGTNWNNLGIANAPIHKEDLDVLDAKIDANTANIATPYGMEISNNSLDAANDIDIAVGIRRDSTQSQNIALTSAFVKATDAAFGIGTAQGGMPAGLLPKAADYYRVFVIKNSTTDAVDVGFDTSATAINLLAAASAISAGFTLYRQIGWIAADSASSYDVIAFHQYDNLFLWDTITTNSPSVAITATPETVQAPPNTVAKLNIQSRVGGSAVTYYGLATSLDSVDQTPSSSLFTVKAEVVFADFTYDHSVVTDIPVDSSSQIRLRLSTANTMGVNSLGYTYNRGL